MESVNSTEAVILSMIQGGQSSLIVSDEFTAGYQCVAETVKKLRTSFYQMENQKVPYTILTRQNLFSQENQDLYLRSVNKMRQASLLRQISSPNMI